MRRQRGLVGFVGLAALFGAGVAGPAVAAVTTEQSASILVFPKVVAAGGRDTIIQITNTSNSVRHAHCFYVNGALTNPNAPPGPTNRPLWTEIDFDIWLTKQQPTHWVVSTGRLDNPVDGSCRGGIACKTSPPPPGSPNVSGGSDATCCDAGFDPGRVPPVVPGFTGELKCIEVDAGGYPVSGNALKGEATLVTVADGDVSKYNAIGLKGFDANNGDGTLCLGGEVSDQCSAGPEYEACPANWIVDHAAVGAPDRVAGVGSHVTTNLTVVPCTQNFEAQTAPPITLQFKIYNEYEQAFSTSTTVDCWGSYHLAAQTCQSLTTPSTRGGECFADSDCATGWTCTADPSLSPINTIFNTGELGGEVVQSFVRAASGTPGGVMMVIEETHSAPGRTARNAQNVHTSPSSEDQIHQDIITIPADQISISD